MKNAVRALLAIAVLSCLLAPISAQARDGDWNYWNNEEIEYKFRKDWKAKIEEELRFNDQMGKFYYEHVQPSVSYDPAKWLTLMLGYRDIFEKPKNTWLHESQPCGETTFKHELSGFEVSDKSRLEWRLLEARTDVWTYRNLVKIKLPKFTKFEIRPYTANEFFFDCNSIGHSQNRLYGGAEFTLLEWLKGELFYMWKYTKSGGVWVNANVFGSKLKISF